MAGLGAPPPVARHVDPVAALVPVAHSLHGVRIGLARGDVLVRMRLLHAVHERVALERRDAPVVLVLVGQMHPVALLHDALKQVPVGVKRRVDVQRDPGHRRTTVGRCPECSPPTPCPASPRRARKRGQDYGETAEPSWRNVDWRALLRTPPVRRLRDQLHRPDPGGPRRPAPHAGGLRPRPRRPVAELDREHPAPGARAAHGGARPARVRHSPPCRPSASPSRTTPRWWRPPATTSGSAPWRSWATRWAASSAPSWPSASRSAWSGSMLVSAAGITTTNLYRAPVLTLGRARRGHGHRRTPPPATASSRGGRSRGTWRWRWWRGTRAGWLRTWPTRP